MAQLGVALVTFAKLVRLLESGGASDGEVRWQWLGNPLEESLRGMQSQRQLIGTLHRALLDRDIDRPDTPFGPGRSWEPIQPIDALEGGLAWTGAGPLDVALAIRSHFRFRDRPIDFELCAVLASIDNGVLTPKLGTLDFKGSLPTPSFLESAIVEGRLPNAGGQLRVARADGEQRSLASDSPALPWDALRVATFVAQAWVQEAALNAPGGFLARADKHLFPMLGEPGGVIAPFPLFGAASMGTAPGFDPWKDSVLTTEGNASGALTFLWHLRALLTNNEKPEFWDGSFYFQLTGDGPAAGAPPDRAAHSLGPLVLPAGDSAWLAIRDDAPGRVALSVRLVQADGTSCSIDLAHLEDGALSRPVAIADWQSATQFFDAWAPLALVDGIRLSVSQDADTRRLSVLQQQVDTGHPSLDGVYEFAWLLRENLPAEYGWRSPLPLPTLPPAEAADAAAAQFADVMGWLVATSANADHPLAALTRELGALLRGAAGGAADSTLLLEALVALLQQAAPAANLQIGPLSIRFAAHEIELALSLGPFAPSSLSLPIHIGKLTAGARVALDPAALAPVAGLSLALFDLRPGVRRADEDLGLVGELLPDLKAVPGFGVSVDWKPPADLTLAGGGRIPVQQQVGPVHLHAFDVALQRNALRLGFDLSFQLGPITASASDLGLVIPFDAAPTPFLRGLGLAYDRGGIKLAGMFGEVTRLPGPSDYVGAALVSVADYFSLSAIGGYTRTAQGDASMFIFAALAAPLGGPPWFFVTGVAGGFGFNRLLPMPGLLAAHPFMRVMRKEIDLGGGSGAALRTLSAHFPARQGAHWIAAGFEFSCFGFINGQLIVAVGLGQRFSLSMLGLASYGIADIAYFEIAIDTTADEQKLLVKGGLTPNSFLLHRDLFSLRGEFALGVWYGGANAGDFLLTVGGYHPAFRRPAHYPDIARVGASTVLYGFVNVSIEAFFACTPQALMAGAALTLSGSFAGIRAGFSAYADVCMRWDPFYLRAQLDVAVWFEFLGRHEASVELRLHTPPFGASATIDALIEFDVSFGEPLRGTSPFISLPDFFNRHLRLPAAPFATGLGDGVKVNAFGDGQVAGLFRVNITAGRLAQERLAEGAKQEGIDAPIPVGVEFEFDALTRLPYRSGGNTSLPLAHEAGLTTTLRVDVSTQADAILPAEPPRALADDFPSALFGEPLPEAHTGSSARDTIAAIDPATAVISLSAGWSYTFAASLQGALAVTGREEERSLSEQEYPLPLGNAPVAARRKPQEWLRFAAGVALNTVTLQGARVSRRAGSLARMTRRELPPLHVSFLSAPGERTRVALAGRSSSVARPPADVRLIDVPMSRARRPEMLAMQLRTLAPSAPSAPFALPRRRLEGVAAAAGGVSQLVTPATGTRDLLAHDFELEVGQSGLVQLRAESLRGARLHANGEQRLRAVCLDACGELAGDLYLDPVADIELPARTRTLVVCGEGSDPPLPLSRNDAAHPALGIDHDSTLLCLGRRSFAAHGTVLIAHADVSLPVRPLDSVPGFLLLRTLGAMRLQFPAVQRNALLLTLHAQVARPSWAAEQIRWSAPGAELGARQVVVGATTTALVMDVTALAPWFVDLFFGAHWRLASAALLSDSSRALLPVLRQRSDWDFIDDRVCGADGSIGSRIHLEVTP